MFGTIRRLKCCRNGFSLVELLVVIGILSLLISLAAPAIQQIRGMADSILCKSRIRNIGIALHSYHNDHGNLPPSRTEGDSRYSPDEQLGWMAHILPYIERDELYRDSVNACRKGSKPTDNPPHTGFTTVINLYVCPADSRLSKPQTDGLGVTAAFTSYIGSGGVKLPSQQSIHPGGLTIPGVRFSEIRDGLTYTILAGERPPPDTFQAGWWYPAYLGSGIGNRGPNNILYLGGVSLFLSPDEPCAISFRNLGPGRTANPCDRFHYWSLHGKGAHFLFADASARFLTYSADPIIPQLVSIRGGESVEIPD